MNKKYSLILKSSEIYYSPGGLLQWTSTNFRKCFHMMRTEIPWHQCAVSWAAVSLFFVVCHLFLVSLLFSVCRVLSVPINLQASEIFFKSPRQEAQDHLPLSRSMMTQYTYMRDLVDPGPKLLSKIRLFQPVLIQRRRINFMTMIRTGFWKSIRRKLS